ncbi:MAG: restriction endonuclease subunit S [Sulfuritalea sp.]|nr:restriction endonuclease subunit S [Sulfuritalea sp.]MDP1984765.1 restriction endonuclease subunit S [Sulfuritalea sp.]
MPWPVSRLDEVANVVAGNPAPQDPTDFVEGGHLFIRMQDVGREHRTANIRVSVDRVSTEAVAKYRLRLFPSGSVLIPKSGASVNLNHRAMLGCDAYVVSHLAVIVPNQKMLLSEYLYYWSLSYDPRNQAQTTSLPSLPLSLIKAASIPIPPFPEQRRIVDLLSRAEGIVRLRREAARCAAELIPALFLDLFGDPATNPQAWPVVCLGELISDGPQNGLYKHSSMYGDGTPILRIDAFYDGQVSDLKALKRLRATEAERNKFRLKSRDIVINRVNSVEYLGKSAIIPPLGEETVFESNMMRFAVDETRVVPEYVIEFLQTGFAKAHFLANAKHAINQSSINQQDVTSLRVPVPPLGLQQNFAERVEQVRSIQSQQSAATAKAQAAFDALLARCFAQPTSA